MNVRARLKLGLIPVGSETEAKVRASFAGALGGILGTPVDLHIAADYRVLVAALEQRLVDFAWLPPLPAARTLRSGAIEAAAISIRNGGTSYMTGLLTLKTSGIQSLADLRGVRAAWVDRESASGYVVIRAALREAGVPLVDAFREEIFMRSHGEVARALRAGLADVGATCFNFFSGSFTVARWGHKDESLGTDEVRILAHAGPIPSDIFAVHKDRARGTLPTIQAALVDARPALVHTLAKGLMHADGFARPTTEHLAMLESLFRTQEPARRSTPPSR